MATNLMSSVGSIKRSDFTYKPDEKFVFGSATASYQIEGGAFEGGKGLSIWDAFALNTPEYIDDGSNGNVAVNQYNMFKEDVKLMKKTGLDAYRFSISWSRILPGGKLSTGVNKEGIKYYNDLIDTLLAEGLQPYVTLFHWDLPLTLELEYGGFLDKRIVEHFCDYVELCFWEFGDRVKNWITTNEAWTYVWKGYVNGQFPPGRGSTVPSDIQLHAFDSLRNRSLSAVTDLIGAVPIQTLNEIDHLTRTLIPSWMKEKGSKFSMLHIDDFITTKVSDVLKSSHPKVVEFIKDALISLQVTYKTGSGHRACPNGDAGTEPYVAAHNMILAHAHAVKIYRDKFQAHQGGEIGMTNNINFYVPYDETKKEDQEAAERAKDFMLYWFVEPIVTGQYPESMRKRVGKNLPTFTPEEKEIVKGSFDFLGINYYTTYFAMNMPKYPNSPGHYDLDQEVQTTPMRNGKPIGLKCGSPWLYSYPLGIYLTLVELTNKFKDENGQGPVICITENGADELCDKKQTVCDARYDTIRLNYHNDHLWYMKKALDEGVKCKGYFLWSFADNYEWAEGYGVRFGIFFVDFVNGRYTRYPKSSALWWTRFMHDVQELALPDVAKGSDSSSKRLITNGEEEENDPKKRQKIGK